VSSAYRVTLFFPSFWLDPVLNHFNANSPHCTGPSLNAASSFAWTTRGAANALTPDGIHESRTQLLALHPRAYRQYREVAYRLAALDGRKFHFSRLNLAEDIYRR
jgi:hypothetical protein